MGKIIFPSKIWDNIEKNNDLEEEKFNKIQSYSWDNEEDQKSSCVDLENCELRKINNVCNPQCPFERTHKEYSELPTKENPNCEHKTFSWICINAKYKLKFCCECRKTLELCLNES